MRRSVTLHGPLAARFGPQTINLNVDDFHSLISGLSCAYPGFKRELVKHEGLAIALRDGDDITYISEDSLGWAFDNKPEIHVATAEKGSIALAASAMAQAVTGAASYAATTGAMTAAYAAVYIATTVAIGLFIGKVSQSLAEKPENAKQAKEEESAIFDQPVNLEGQGHPVPLVYGLFKCGSVVISSDIISEKNAVTVDDYFQGDIGTPLVGKLFANDIDGGTMELVNWQILGITYAPGATHNDTGVNPNTVKVDLDGTVTASSTSAAAHVVKFTYTGTSSTTSKSTANAMISWQPVWDPNSNPGGGE